VVLVSQTGLPTTMQFASVLTGQNVNDGLTIGQSDAFGTAALMNYENYPLWFGTNGTEKMRITELGKVGVGITTPQRELVLRNGADTAAIQIVSAITGATKTDGFVIGQTNSTGAVQLMNYENQDMIFGTNATERMVIAQDGRVGVNTPFPTNDFVIKSAVNANTTWQLISANTGAGPSDGLLIQHTNATGAAAIINAEAQPLSLGTSGQNRMSITSGGAVGIGTQSLLPLHNVDVVFNNDATMRILGTGGANNQSILLLDKTDANADLAAIQYGLGNSPQWMVGTLNNNNYRVFNFGTGNDALSIDYNTDNVGIGTPNPSAKLEVNGQIKINGGGPGQGKVLISDANGLAVWGEDNPKRGYTAFSDVGVLPITAGNETQIVFENVDFNDGGHYDPSTGIYNVASEGMYQFNVSVLWGSNSAPGDFMLGVKVGGNIVRQVRQFRPLSSGVFQQNISASFKLYAGDTVEIFVLQNSAATCDLLLNQIENSYTGFKIY